MSHLTPDVLLVLFRPKWQELQDTADALAKLHSEYRFVRVLVSGSTLEFEQVRNAFASVPRTVLIHRFDNLGFASGHNLLLAQSFASGANACLVLNPDLVIEVGALAALAEAAEEVQPALWGPALEQVNDDAKRTVDSLGIVWTASARHLDNRQGESWPAQFDKPFDFVAGLTGACLFVSLTAYQLIVKHSGHFFDDAFLAYREDAELGVRAQLLGVSSCLAFLPGFTHHRTQKGTVRGNPLLDMLGVRNRFLILWTLGRHRPGSPVKAHLRDALVLGAVVVKERSSLPGVSEAFAMRRYLIYGRKRLTSELSA